MKELFLKETRAVLAYFWSFVSALFLGYILVKYGEAKEILTLVIGLIGGTIIGGVFGVYFSANSSRSNTHTNNPPPAHEVETTDDEPGPGTIPGQQGPGGTKS